MSYRGEGEAMRGLGEEGPTERWGQDEMRGKYGDGYQGKNTKNKVTTVRVVLEKPTKK